MECNKSIIKSDQPAELPTTSGLKFLTAAPGAWHESTLSVSATTAITSSEDTQPEATNLKDLKEVRKEVGENCQRLVPGLLLSLLQQVSHAAREGRK